MTTRIAVLASGRGTNLRALMDYCARHAGEPEASVALVVSDRSDAGALELARERGVPGVALATRGDHTSQLAAELDRHAVELVVLGGYLRLVPQPVVRRFAGRIINVHPALLPAFGGKGMYGQHVHRAVLASGARVSGVSVHFVDEAYDRGAIIAQWPVPVFADDSEHTLAERVLRVEHLLLPRVVGAVARGGITLGADNRVRGAFCGASSSAAFSLSGVEEGTLVADIERALAG